jgi:branched-chain amino acid transport system substrate-binding protein
MRISNGTRRLLALLAALAMLGAACGGDDDGDAAQGGDSGEDGQSAEPIVLGALCDLTGATGDVGTPWCEAVRGYVDWRNADGGVGGRQIDLRWQDYQYDVSVAERLYSEYVAEGAVGVIGWGTGDTEALRGRIAQDEVPFVSASLSENLTDPEESPYNFVALATYSDNMRIALDYIADQDPGAAVAVFHHDSPFGTSPVPDGEAHIEEAGLDISDYQAYAMPGGATDYSSELRQALDRGADWVVINNVASPCAQLVSNVAEQNLDLNGVIGLNWCTSEILLELAGDAAEGFYGVSPVTPPTGDAEGLEPLREYLEGQGETLEDKGVHYVQAWYTTHVLVEGIAQVVEAGDEVTGPNIKAAMEETTVDTGGAIPEVDFSAESHRGSNAASIWVVEDGQFVEVESQRTPQGSGDDA